MRLPPELKAELQKMADEENRSLTNFIETKLREIVRAHSAAVSPKSHRQQPRTDS